MNQGFVLSVFRVDVLSVFLIWDENFRFEHVEVNELKLIMGLCWRRYRKN